MLQTNKHTHTNTSELSPIDLIEAHTQTQSHNDSVDKSPQPKAKHTKITPKSSNNKQLIRQQPIESWNRQNTKHHFVLRIIRIRFFPMSAIQSNGSVIIVNLTNPIQNTIRSSCERVKVFVCVWAAKSLQPSIFVFNIGRLYYVNGFTDQLWPVLWTRWTKNVLEKKNSARAWTTKSTCARADRWWIRVDHFSNQLNTMLKLLFVVCIVACNQNDWVNAQINSEFCVTYFDSVRIDFFIEIGKWPVTNNCYLWR